MPGVTQLTKRLEDSGLVADPAVGGLTVVDIASAGYVADVSCMTQVVAPATPALPRSKTTAARAK